MNLLRTSKMAKMSCSVPEAKQTMELMDSVSPLLRRMQTSKDACCQSMFWIYFGVFRSNTNLAYWRIPCIRPQKSPITSKKRQNANWQTNRPRSWKLTNSREMIFRSVILLWGSLTRRLGTVIVSQVLNVPNFFVPWYHIFQKFNGWIVGSIMRERL